MAKRIKPIKCPQCGGTQATETKPDYYRCNSCQSEFFIDSNDININHRHTYDTPQISIKNLKTLKWLGIGIAIFFLVMMFFSMFWSSPTPIYNDSVRKNKSYWDIEQIIPTTDKDGEPIAVAVGDIVSGNHPNEIYKPTFGFFHAKTFKEIATVPINVEKVLDVRWKKMDEGKTYIIINKNHLFLLDEKTLSISEVTPQSIGLPEFEKGFAEIKTNSIYENTLRITNNLGREYYYSPKLNQAILYGNHKEIEQLVAQSPIGSQVLTQFAFSRKDDDKLPELFKVKTQRQAGYPYKALSLRWYNGGLYIDKESRVVSYENFTPERFYFKPEILHYDDKEVFIYFKHDVSESSPYFFQVLDAQTGELKSTLQRKGMHHLTDDYVSKTKDGYLITLHGIFLLNTKDGKLEELELREVLTQR